MFKTTRSPSVSSTYHPSHDAKTCPVSWWLCSAPLPADRKLIWDGVVGFFPLPPVYCLAWICLDVLFCTASIMHLCTISVDRYLSLRYPMKFGRNKTRRRVTLKIVFVWLLSTAMSLPLCLMYSQVPYSNDSLTISIPLKHFLIDISSQIYITITCAQPV